MSGTNVLSYSTQIAHIGSGTSMAPGAINASSDVSTELSSSNLARYPLADVQLMFKHTTSLSSLSNTITLYRRDLNFDGANSEPVPNSVYATASSNTLSYYKAKPVGIFVANAFSISNSNSYTQYLQCTDVPLADACQFYLGNDTNTAILAGWTLKVVPKADAF